MCSVQDRNLDHILVESRLRPPAHPIYLTFPSSTPRLLTPMLADQGKQQKKRIRTKEDDAWDSDEEEKALRAARIREREDLLDRRGEF
jgi:hypothetical protein